MSDTYVIYPRIIDELLENPGIGFIAAPGLMEPEGVIHDNRGNTNLPITAEPGIIQTAGLPTAEFGGKIWRLKRADTGGISLRKNLMRQKH